MNNLPKKEIYFLVITILHRSFTATFFPLQLFLFLIYKNEVTQLH